MKHIARAALALALLSAVILGACSENPVGIFESLSLETPIDNGTKAFEYSTPNFVVEFSGDYYAGVGALWKRAATEGGTWSRVSNAPAALAVSAAVAGTRLYVLFNEAEGNAASIAYTDDGLGWTELDTSAVVAGTPLRLFFDGTGLITYGRDVITAEPYASEGRLYSGESFTALDTARSGLDVVDLADDGPGSFVAVGAWLDVTALDSAISVDGTVFVNETGQPGAPVTLRGVGHDATIGFILAGSDGKLYRRNAANDWNATTTALKNSSGAVAVLSDVVVVPANGVGNAVLAGSQSYGATGGAGYFEFDDDSFGTFGDAAANTGYNLVSTLTNFQTTLEDKSVTKFFYDGDVAARTPGRLFALTGGDGLWSNEWDGTSWSGWNRE